MTVRRRVVNNFLKLLEMNAIVMSQITKPNIMAKLYKTNSLVPYDVAVRARTDPYIPSQKSMVSGFEMDIKNPDKKDTRPDSASFPFLITIFLAPMIVSIPVYIRTKKPKNQRKVCINGVSRNLTTPM
jgi:hypothetical protein